MIRTNSDDFDQERLTNMAAVAVNRFIEGSVSGTYLTISLLYYIRQVD